MDSIVLKETREWIEVASAVKPRRRDFWAVLRGRYYPKLVITKRLTMAGYSKMIKERYSDPIREQLNQEGVFLDALAPETEDSDLP